MSGLTSFDYVILAMIGVMAVSGFARGFVREVLNLASWIAAIFAVRLFHEQLTPVAAEWAGGQARGATLAFVLLFAGTLIVGKLLATFIGGATRNSLIGPVDRLLGFGLGALKGLIAASAIFLVLDFTTNLFDDDKARPAWLAQSRATPVLDTTSRALVTWVERTRRVDAASRAEPEPSSGSAATSGARRDDPGYTRSDRNALEDLIGGTKQ